MRKKIEQSLIEQLKAKKADIEAFRALVSDYGAMAEMCEGLRKDIKETGTIIDGKANPAVKEFRDTSKAMLAILKQLGLSSDNITIPEDDEL